MKEEQYVVFLQERMRDRKQKGGEKEREREKRERERERWRGEGGRREKVMLSFCSSEG